ncbi:uncharacterized protein V1513DRAFT_426569 [Lipomyces chichibuensis]|uniref:uncharacterized protein n=1 Tax=Lipomyces chichibuensis TaxID=1546026 RepID=UPI003343D888
MEPVSRSVGVAIAVVLVILLSFLISLRLRRIRHGAGPPFMMDHSPSGVMERRRRRDGLGSQRLGRTADTVAIDLQHPDMQQEMPRLSLNEQNMREMTLPLYEQSCPPTYEEAVQRLQDECEDSDSGGQVNGHTANVEHPERALMRESLGL